MHNKRGEILIESVIFIILNLAFLTILVLFLVKQGASGALLEDAYSKQIALIIDSAVPGMSIEINLEEGFKLAEENGILLEDIVQIEKNIVRVKLSEKGGKEYSFFNNVSVEPYLAGLDEKYGVYVLPIAKN